MPAAPIHQYLPRLVREWDDEAAGRLHRAIDGSMVFVDVSGFTKMSERLARHGKVGAEEVTEVIGGTFDRLLGEAYAYGASLLKFGGDALLLFFQGDGHYLRAAAAAADMRRSLRDLGRLKTSAGLVSLRMSVGVHSGLFDFFMVGESHRELIVAGPAATATTAMEAAASAGQILLSPASASLLPKRNVRSRWTGSLSSPPTRNPNYTNSWPAACGSLFCRATLTRSTVQLRSDSFTSWSSTT
jgi:class 3 adenylate cyclase